MATSINTYTMSGNITSDAIIMDGKKGKVARFSIAHNFARHMEPLYVDVVMFPTNGRKEIAIPVDSLKKGNRVVVSGYMKPNNYKKEDGTIIRKIDFIALSCEVSEKAPVAATEPEAEQEAEAVEAQAAPVEEPKPAKKTRKASRK